MESEIEINGKKYVEKSKVNVTAPKNKKGLTFCVIRTYSAGVFAGWIDRKIKGKERTIFDSRRLWRWQAKKGIDCSSIATHGINPKGCKFSEFRPEIDLTEVIEIQPCTKEAMESIISVEAFKND